MFTEKEVAFAIAKCEALWQADEDRYKVLKRNALNMLEDEGIEITSANLFARVYTILLTED